MAQIMCMPNHVHFRGDVLGEADPPPKKTQAFVKRKQRKKFTLWAAVHQSALRGDEGKLMFQKLNIKINKLNLKAYKLSPDIRRTRKAYRCSQPGLSLRWRLKNFRCTFVSLTSAIN